ncbi:hypothetical protein HPB51_016271 [Rhipicephalus microplus]|uniref:Tick transposon n=1 Tax=Rhipicephalus microplus TaxID=6941 RepID=A0A9J6ETA0_RHIMP|nr:hypothetical protein HPB51_016271 [Rhipicephalus microplus]
MSLGRRAGTLHNFATFRVLPLSRTKDDRPHCSMTFLGFEKEMSPLIETDGFFTRTMSNYPFGVGFAAFLLVCDTLPESGQFLPECHCEDEGLRRRLQLLITATVLSDRRPSQLLRRMRQLLGGPSAPQEKELLRELFLQRLPQSLVPVLVAAGDVLVDTLAEMADRLADYSRAHSLNAVTTPPPATAADPALTRIENRLGALVRQLDDFVPAHRRSSSRFQIHSRSLTPPRSQELRPPDAPRDVSSSTVCWHHRRFGASARKCTRPCSWSAYATTGY